MRRAVLVAGVTGAAAAGASVVGTLGAATYFARRVITPDRRRPDDTEIRAVDGGTLTLNATDDTVIPGSYGLWLDGGDGHARLGDLVDLDENAGTVRRELLGVDRGRLTAGYGRWNPYFYGDRPDRSLGLPTSDVIVGSDVGDLPAWLVPAAAGTVPGGRWAVLVHGRGARREECLRAVPVLHDLGRTCLIPMYRNDIGAPPSPDGRYNLGLSEWRDVEAAILYAVRHGADAVDLVGWSMGGAIVLQTLDRSWLAERVAHVVLDAPVIDWTDVLRHHAGLNAVPGLVGAVSRNLIGRRSARRVVGVHQPLDVAETDWVRRAGELRHPILLVHSVDDEFVPAGPSAELARRRPDLVRYEPWTVARHTQEWNVDPERWNAVIRDFLPA
jgi:pimeloyl-ACP methyl ester carboxylesterase